MATKTIPWNVKDYGSAHPLDEDQLRYLASEFKLPRERLDEMGSGLAFALNPRTAQRDLLLPRAAEKRGREEFEKAVTEIAQAEKKLARAIQRLEMIDISVSDDFAKLAMRGASYIRELEKMHTMIGAYRLILMVKVERRGATPTLRGIADKRLLRDHRRRILCNTVLRMWVDSGRDLTITTDNRTSERSGVLIDFTNAVVGMVTTPATRINGETLRVEIECFKTNLQRERATEDRQTQV